MKTILSAKKSLLNKGDFQQIAGTAMAERMVSNKLAIRAPNLIQLDYRRQMYVEIRDWCMGQCAEAVYMAVVDDLKMPYSKIRIDMYFSSPLDAAGFKVFWDQLEWDGSDDA